MLLRDLLETPGLGLRLLYGDSEVLDRPVRWTYSSDLMDPGRYLSGGEVVISGLIWRQDEADSDTFVSNVARAGALALAAGEAQFGCVPQDVVDACRRHGLALLAVPEDVSFSVITEHIIGSAATERGARLAATLGRHRELLSSMAQGGRLDDVVERVARETGVAVRVLATTGRAVVPGPKPLETADVDRITRTFLTADRFPAVAGHRGGQAYSLFPVGPALGLRLAMWIVVAEGDLAQWPAATADSFAELAAITQLERSRIEEGHRIRRPIVDDAVRLVATGATSQPETAVRLRQAGLDPEAELAVAVVGMDDGDPTEEERAIVHEAVGGIDGAVVAQGPDGGTVALLPCGDSDWADQLRTSFGRLAPGLGQRRLCIGLSDCTGLAGLTGMWEEARHARQLASVGDEPVSIVSASQITSHVMLLASVPDDIRRLFATRVLGPVVEYDEGHDAQLRTTLESFLRHSGSWNRTAKALHLHVNSVRYRIARVEELTGRDLSRLEDRVDIFLALRSL